MFLPGQAKHSRRSVEALMNAPGRLHAILHANLENHEICGILEKRKSLFPWILRFSTILMFCLS
jgi:hypothetical protein